MAADFFLDGALLKLGILSVIIPGPQSQLLNFKQKIQNLWTIPGWGLGNQRGNKSWMRGNPLEECLLLIP